MIRNDPWSIKYAIKSVNWSNWSMFSNSSYMIYNVCMYSPCINYTNELWLMINDLWFTIHDLKSVKNYTTIVCTLCTRVYKGLESKSWTYKTYISTIFINLIAFRTQNQFHRVSHEHWSMRPKACYAKRCGIEAKRESETFAMNPFQIAQLYLGLGGLTPVNL